MKITQKKLRKKQRRQIKLKKGRENQKIKGATVKKARNITLNTSRHESKKTRIAVQAISMVSSSMKPKPTPTPTIMSKSDIMGWKKDRMVEHCESNSVTHYKSWSKTKLADAIFNNQ